MELPVHVGQVVAGKYEVERILALGGVGVVVKARHRALLEPCAIKLMLPEAAASPLARERFLREARACARLKSDHVVRVFDVGETDDETPYMVLEYLEGVDLEGHMDDRPLPVAEAARYAVEICAGLAEAHALGIVHRDLKPANVFLARQPDGSVRVKLLDFGISKLLEDPAGLDQARTIEGTIMGTPFFMAPEQVQGGDVDVRTDVWALGVLLYYLVTGRLPFEGDHLTATFDAILDRDPAPPSVHVPTLPPPIEAIILCCLQKAPLGRPANVREIAAALAPFAAAEDPPAASAISPRARRALDSAAAAPVTPAAVPPPAVTRAPVTPPAASSAPVTPSPYTPTLASGRSAPPATARTRNAPGVAIRTGSGSGSGKRGASSAPPVVVEPARAHPRWALPAAIAGCVAAALLAAWLAPRSPEAPRDVGAAARLAPKPARDEPPAAPTPSPKAEDATDATGRPPPRAPRDGDAAARTTAPAARDGGAASQFPAAPSPPASIPAPSASAGAHVTPRSTGFALGNRQSIHRRRTDPCPAPPRRAPLLGALALALLVAWPRPSRAQGAADRAATAQGLYESAAQLIKAGKLAEACPKLEESERLDPAMGTRFFLAGCYESTGRPTKAWSLFLEVASVAKAAGNTVREITARQRAAALEPRLPRITVFVAEADAALPGLRVVRGDAPLKPIVWGSAIPVDFGRHTVRATAPGKAPWEATVVVSELGQRIEVRVPPLENALTSAGGDPPAAPGGPDAEAAAGAAAAPPARESLPPQKVAALVVGGAGVAGLVAGGALGLAARGAWSQATDACPARTACSPAAHDDSARAVSLAAGSTAAFAVGGAATAAGLVTWLAAPSRRSSGPLADARGSGPLADARGSKAWARLRLAPAAAGAWGVFLTGDL